MGAEQPKLARLPGQEDMSDAEVVIHNKYREKMRKTEDELARLKNPHHIEVARPKKIDANILSAQQRGTREEN